MLYYHEGRFKFGSVNTGNRTSAAARKVPGTADPRKNLPKRLVLQAYEGWQQHMGHTSSRLMQALHENPDYHILANSENIPPRQVEEQPTRTPADIEKTHTMGLNHVAANMTTDSADIANMNREGREAVANIRVDEKSRSVQEVAGPSGNHRGHDHTDICQALDNVERIHRIRRRVDTWVVVDECDILEQDRQGVEDARAPPLRRWHYQSWLPPTCALCH
jgi:hypothetical protein